MSTITLTRTVRTSPQTAWRAWTDPAELAQWWWPQWADTGYDLEVRVGGGYRIFSEAVGLGVTGEFTDVPPPSGDTAGLLAMTWIWHDPEPTHLDPDDTVEVTFEPVDDGTLVTVRHTSVAHEPEGGAERGWSDCLDRLVSRS